MLQPSQTYTVDGLLPFTQYIFEVQACTEAGWYSAVYVGIHIMARRTFYNPVTHTGVGKKND